MNFRENNILTGNLKYYYLDLDNYKKDFQELQNHFFKKNNTIKTHQFIQAEIKRYTKILQIANGENKAKTLAGQMIEEHEINLAYLELKPGIFDNDFQYVAGNKIFDETFVSIACENIIEFLNSQLNLNKNTQNIEPLDFDLNQSEVIFLFNLLMEANLLKVPEAHNGSYWQKLSTYFTARGKKINNPRQLNYKLEERGGYPSQYKDIIDRLINCLHTPRE